MLHLPAVVSLKLWALQSWLECVCVCVCQNEWGMPSSIFPLSQYLMRLQVCPSYWIIVCLLVPSLMPYTLWTGSYARTGGLPYCVYLLLNISEWKSHLQLSKWCAWTKRKPILSTENVVSFSHWMFFFLEFVLGCLRLAFLSQGHGMMLLSYSL